MASDHWEQLHRVFCEASALPASERPEFLDAACGQDADLRAEVDRLLAHVDTLPDDLKPLSPEAAMELLRTHASEQEPDTLRERVFEKLSPPSDVDLSVTEVVPLDAAAAPDGLDAGQPVTGGLPTDAFPGYEIVREIHHGGQGVVYQALQQSTKRKVAIKVLLEGAYASEKTKRRFEREIELVASLKHPNVISVFHSGQTRDGRQFCVMDYVRGVPIDQYVREKKLPLEEALKLFATVCEAVNYAHQKGVIHRDLKPSNILVDAEGVPKVLDFGLAKLVGGPEQTLVSITGQVVGTLPYMSPEQARGNPDEIDTRTDVYALGVILYEILTGAYPYPVVGQMADVLKHIAETPPTPPSRQWKPDSGVSSRSTKRLRVGDCPIDDELQTIVLKTLSKERERRYQSGAELAKDVQHYLVGEPIEAKRDSGLYILKKNLRRYRVPVAVVTGFIFLLTAGLIVSSTLYLRAESARREAQAERQRAELEKARADLSAAEAREALIEADAQRTIAEDKSAEAAQALKKAEEEQDRAKKEAENVQRRLYLNQIALAQSAYDSYDVYRLARLLGQCEQKRRGWEWYHLTGLSDTSSRVYRGHRSAIIAVAVSPDGEFLLSGDMSGTIKLWQLSSADVVRSYYGKPLTALALSPDGRLFATAEYSSSKSSASEGSGAYNVRLWDLSTGRSRWIRSGHTEAIHGLAFSPDGSHILSGSTDYHAKLWEVETGNELHQFDHGGGRWIYSVAFSPDGEQFAIASLRGVELWDLASYEKVESFKSDPASGYCVAFSPDGRLIASGHDRLAIYDSQSGELQRLLPGHTKIVTAVAFSPDGQKLASLSKGENTLRVWKVESGEELFAVGAHYYGADALAFTPDGKGIATGGGDTVLRLWSIPPQAGTMVLDAEYPPFSVAITPDGKAVVSGHFPGYVRVREIASREELLPAYRAQAEYILAVAVNPDGRRIAMGDETGNVRICSIAGEEISELCSVEPQSGRILHLAFSYDGSILASCAEDGIIRFSDASSGKKLGEDLVSGHRMTRRLAFSPDNSRLVAGGSGLTIWDCNTRKKCVDKPEVIDTWLEGVEFTHGGRYLLTVSGYGRIIYWNAETGKYHSEVRASGEQIQSCAISPDHRRVGLGMMNGTIVLVDTYTGTETITLSGHRREVTSLAFSPDGRILVSAGMDNSIRIWRAASDSEVSERENMITAGYMVDGLFSLGLDCELVIQTLKKNASTGDTVAELAVRLARNRGDNPGQLNTDAWFNVRSPVGNEETYKSCLRQAEIATRLAPEEDQYLTTLGAALYRNEKYQEALDVLIRADTLNDGSPQAVAFIALSYRRLGRVTEAQLTLDRFHGLMQTDQWMNDPEAQGLLYELLSEFGENAWDQFRDIPARPIDHPERINFYAWLVASRPAEEPEAYETARSWAHIACQLAPTDGNILNTLGVAQYRMGKYAEALATLTESDRIIPGRPANVAFIAMAHHRLGSENEAKAALESLRQIMQQEKCSEDAEAQAFFGEALKLLEESGSGPSAEPDSSSRETRQSTMPVASQ